MSFECFFQCTQMTDTNQIPLRLNNKVSVLEGVWPAAPGARIRDVLINNGLVWAWRGHTLDLQHGAVGT